MDLVPETGPGEDRVRRTGRAVAWALTAALLAAGEPALSQAPDTGPSPLAVGSGQVRPVAAGETATWSATLLPGRAYRLSVEQLGIDVEVTATAPDGSMVAIDNPFTFDVGRFTFLVR